MNGDVAGEATRVFGTRWRASLARIIPRRALFATRYLISVGIPLVAFYYVAQRFAEGANAIPLSRLQVNYSLFLFSLSLTLVCTVLGGWLWNVLLSGIGVRIMLRKALKVHLLSILPKYLPGFAWQVVGKAYLSREAGVPTYATALSMVLELAIILLAGASVLLFTLPFASLPAGNQIVALFLGLPLPGIAFAYTLIVPLLLRAAIRSNTAERILGTKVDFSYVRLLFVFVAVALTWVLLGVSLFVLAASLYPVSASQIPSLVFSLTISLITSLLAFFVPVGLGVREGALTFLLSFWLPAPVAAVLAILSRLVSVAGDSIAFVIALKL